MLYSNGYSKLSLNRTGAIPMIISCISQILFFRVNTGGIDTYKLSLLLVSVIPISITIFNIGYNQIKVIGKVLLVFLSLT